MSPDRRPDDFNEAENNAPNPVVEALAIWRETWQATPVERWNRLVLWTTMRDAARARRLLAETDERAFCRGALEEVGVEAKKRRDLIADLAADAELVARLDDLIDASAASETAPTLAELFAVWNLPTSETDANGDAPDATACESERDENAEPSPQSRANSEILYGGAGVGRSFTDEAGAIPQSQARPLEPGDVVVLSDDYEIKRIAGKGGQKAVYEVVSKRLGTRFAVKELLSELGGSEALRRDLEREVKIQARLQHQGIPKVFALTPDADPTSDGLPRFVETYVEGEPWSARPFDRAHFEENLDYLLQVAKIMAYAHDQGVVHRDLKPENVMLGRYGELYVVDWGLAFDWKAEGPKTGAVGTQDYMAPEQASRRPVDKRADVFTLGGILYKILTGFAPYELAQRTQGNAVAGRKAAACDFAPLAPFHVSAQLSDIVAKALAKNPNDRYNNANEFRAALETYLPRSQTLEHFESLKQRFECVRNNLIVDLNDATRNQIAANLIEGMEVLGEITKIRRATIRKLDVPNERLETSENISNLLFKIKILKQTAQTNDAFSLGNLLRIATFGYLNGGAALTRVQVSPVSSLANVDLTDDRAKIASNADVELLADLFQMELEAYDFLIEKMFEFQEPETAKILIDKQRDVNKQRLSIFQFYDFSLQQWPSYTHILKLEEFKRKQLEAAANWSTFVALSLTLISVIMTQEFSSVIFPPLIISIFFVLFLYGGGYLLKNIDVKRENKRL